MNLEQSGAPEAKGKAGPRSDYETLVSGDWYQYRKSNTLPELTYRAQSMCHEINQIFFSDNARALDLFRTLVPKAGEGIDFRPPFFLDYGESLVIGDSTFINSDFMIIGGGQIIIGTNCLIGPSARFYTSTHALDPEVRRDGWEYCEGITIGDNVWLGGSVVICPGVTIGENAVIGAGSVVVKDIPANTVAAGNPAVVIRDSLVDKKDLPG